MRPIRADDWIPAAPLDGTVIGACPANKRRVRIASFGLAGGDHPGLTSEHEIVPFQGAGRHVIRWNDAARLRFRWEIEGFAEVVHAQIEIWRCGSMAPICTLQIMQAAGEAELPREPAAQFAPQLGPFMARLRLTQCRAEAGVEVGELRCYFDPGVMVVIGAGAAGIAAAKYLLETTTDFVTLVEARARVGGRAHSVPAPWDPAEHIDLGCQWIQSPPNNRLAHRGESTIHEQMVNYVVGGALRDMPEPIWLRFDRAVETCRREESLEQAYQRVAEEEPEQAADPEPDAEADDPAIVAAFTELMRGELAELDESVAAALFSPTDERRYIVNAAGAPAAPVLPGNEQDNEQDNGQDDEQDNGQDDEEDEEEEEVVEPDHDAQVLAVLEDGVGLELRTLPRLITRARVPRFNGQGNLLADEGLGTRILDYYQEVAAIHAEHLALLLSHQADRVDLLPGQDYAAVGLGPLNEENLIDEERRFGLAAIGVVVAVPTSIMNHQNPPKLTFAPPLPAQITENVFTIS